MALEVKNSIWRSLLQILISATFVWISWALMIPSGKKLLLAWSCFVFFSGCALVGIYHLFDRRAKILIDQHGIYFPGRHDKIITWEEIAGFAVRKTEYDHRIAVALHNGDELKFIFFFLNADSEQLNQRVQQELRKLRREKKEELDFDYDDS